MLLENGSALSDDQMQSLARERNLSGTVFLLPAEDGDARMPIFTPAAELAFAPVIQSLAQRSSQPRHGS